MKCRKLKWLIGVCLAHIPMIIHAQTKVGNIMLPTVESARNGRCRVCSTWKPPKKFLKHNPDFLKNGSYTMSGKYINKGRHAGHVRKFNLVVPDHTEFSSLDYPAVWIPSDKKINTGGNAFIQVLCSAGYGVRFPLCKGHKAHGRGNAGYIHEYDWLKSYPHYKNAYNNLNDYYKEKTGDIISRKFVNPVYVSDIGSYKIDSVAYGVNDLYFEFEYIETQSVNDHFLAPAIVMYSCLPFVLPTNYALMLTRKSSSHVYPSNQLLKLHVKNSGGQELKTYSQVVFVKEKHLVGLWAREQQSSVGLIFKQTLPAAMESLLNQFAEDTAIMTEIARNQKTIDTTSRNPKAVNYVKQPSVLDSSKEAIEQSISKVQHKINKAEGRVSKPVIDLSNTNQNFGNACPVAVLLVICGEIIVMGSVNGISHAVEYKQISKFTKMKNKLTQMLDQLHKEEEHIKQRQDNTVPK